MAGANPAAKTSKDSNTKVDVPRSQNLIEAKAGVPSLINICRQVPTINTEIDTTDGSAPKALLTKERMNACLNLNSARPVVFGDGANI